MRKMGLVRDIDLALHIPLRYEDETQIVKLSSAREGDNIQIEAKVTASEIQLRPRRQLLVTVDDGTDTCVLRFFNFYPAQQKALAVGQVIRARGEVRGGFLGLTMMHPAFKAATGHLPSELTPVYPTSAGLPQTYLRRAVAGALSRADLSESLPSNMPWPKTPKVNQAFSLRQALTFLHHPTPDVSIAALEDRSHPAWQRLKAEELLAQQLNRPHDVAAHEQLSEREFQVFLKLAKGETAGDIAKALSLSVKTVSTYRTRVMEKMSLASNSDLTYYALKNKLID